MVIKRSSEGVHNFDDFDEALAYVELVRAHEELGSQFSSLFASYSISQPQYNVLRTIYFRGDNVKGLPTQAIRNYLINRVPDVTRLVDRLEKQDLVKRTQSPSDRRIVYVKLTKKGFNLLQNLEEHVMKLHKEQMKNLSRKELTTLLSLLIKIRNTK